MVKKKLCWFEIGLLSILLLICAVGGVRAGSSYYHFLAGEQAWEDGDFETARDLYERSFRSARAMELKQLCEKSRIGLALSLDGLGESEKAAAVLGMEKGWKKIIGPDEWKGPTGQQLYKNVSCWKDLGLLRGEVEIQVFAKGQPAQGVWPRMQVHLGELLLGEVEITSREEHPYFFFTKVETGIYRLKLTFLNDFWELGIGDRWIEIGQVELECERNDW